MEKLIRFHFILLAACAIALLGGCASRVAPTIYDFGPVRAEEGNAPLPALRPVSIAEPVAPTWLDNTFMLYRLSYANDQQPHAYAQSRWSMAPAALLVQRLKSRIAQAGGAALSASDGAANVPLLRIELENFMQDFTVPAHSLAQISLRASLFNGRTLVAQKTFAAQTPAPSADASGGARALAAASDMLIRDMVNWLAMLQTAGK
ncbi:ABC-type transport auxiliary lipoprotein family protein [Noviherbaspirillum massiliense]|uniref:ABC-type transport auxiliary lipoprotein family protein n=1 Tax=Noviherbaspirillum massiliense TaxID=1465823 RepID=UPI000310CC26|nr:ABC-type transport auxiliary lipoprotein family protein [Noviherbaspirillum massiliense]